MQVHVQDRPEAERRLQLKVQYDPASLRISHTLIGVRVELKGSAATEIPGAPALPTSIMRLALPRGMRAAEIAVETETSVALTSEAVPLAPVQPPRAGAVADHPPYGRPLDAKWGGRRRCVPAENICGAPSATFPVPDYVPPDPALYEAASGDPAARILANETFGATPVALIAVRPVSIADDGHLEFATELEISVRLEPGEDSPEVPLHIISRAQALRDIALTKTLVVNPREVIDYKHRFPIELLVNADYLIVTDNDKWDPETQAPAGPAGGDLVATFKRLAAWKRQRGLQTKVVTVSEIVDGVWGDFRTGTRDLQETIRNFLKMAYGHWGVAWVLLGGDTAIVPIRYAAGGLLGGVSRQAVDPPPDNTSVWSGNHLRIKAVNLGVWWETSPQNKLVRADDGRTIPYDAAGTSSPTTVGWYFTTDESYATQSAIPTQFVRVNGPASLANGDMQFLYMWNSIPTDFYYSSLVGEAYNLPGRHDWDLLDQGIYGKSTTSAKLGGINYWPSVSLGRAPVNDEAEAVAFVDKVIAYEKFQAPDGTDLDPDWPARTVLASENWGGRAWIFGTSNTPPNPGQYYHAASSNHTIIQLAAVPDWDWSLLSVVTADDVRVIPYRTDAAAAGRGWYFAMSATKLNPRGTFIPVGTKLVWLPMPSRWIAVYGAEIEIAPPSFAFDSTVLDGSLADQEELRSLLSAKTGFGPAVRLYQDVQDMTPAQLSAAPVEILGLENLRDALNAGPHIVSLSGHGNSNGCCTLSRSLAAGLKNGFHNFIAYADSCLTSQLDAPAMSEAIVANPYGGAVAYVGSSRFSWIGVGDDFQRAFFDQWAALGKGAHLGVLTDTRAGLSGNFGGCGYWTVLALNLLGCPEMPLWWARPDRFQLPPVQLNERIRFQIEHPPRPDPPFGDRNPYVDEWDVTRIHVRQGDHEQTLAVRGETVDVPISGFRRGQAIMTIVRAGFLPLVRDVHVGYGRYRLVMFAIVGLVLAVFAFWIVSG